MLLNENKAKEKIKNCFNSKAYTYDRAADVQGWVAQQLAKQLEGVDAKTVLEIGCGTGLFSQFLVKQYPHASCLLTDIAPAMVEICEKRFATTSLLQMVQTRCMDGEALILDPPEQVFDLITSSMTLHWFRALEQSIQAIIAKLAPRGRFIFALLGKNSLQEWRAICQKQQVSIPTPDFPDLDYLTKIFPNITWHTENLQCSYLSAYDFLKTLKMIGAHAAHSDHAVFSAGKLRRLMRAFEDVTITYEIIYGSYIQS
jgi:malonyl-CoA O-methyltransferase